MLAEHLQIGLAVVVHVGRVRAHRDAASKVSRSSARVVISRTAEATSRFAAVAAVVAVWQLRTAVDAEGMISRKTGLTGTIDGTARQQRKKRRG